MQLEKIGKTFLFNSYYALSYKDAHFQTKQAYVVILEEIIREEYLTYDELIAFYLGIEDSDIDKINGIIEWIKAWSKLVVV